MATYEFTAFAEEDLLSAGSGNGSNLGNGDTFIMPDTAELNFEVLDNDAYLSGDNRRNENADDWSYQTAQITDADGNEVGNGGQVYAEVYHWVYDQHGNWYVMIEIEQEGDGQDYFTFFIGSGYDTPPAGAELTISCSRNVTCDWIKMTNLDAGDLEEPGGWVRGRLTFDEDGNDNEWNEDTNSWDVGVEGQIVQLLDLDGNVVAETTTDANGGYIFQVDAGDYQVKFPLLEGYEFSAQDSGVHDHYDSDADATGLTGVISVSNGETVKNVDAGLKQAPINNTADAIDDELSVLSTETADETPDGNVLDNDVDPEGDALTVAEVNGDADNVGAAVAGSDGGTVVINADGSYEFDANGDFDYLARGETAQTTFEYSITDGVSSEGDKKQNIVFVIDVSSSTSPAEFEGTPVGDQNGDGVENSVLDAEIAAYKALSAEIASKGLDPSLVDIGLVIFSGNYGSNQSGASQIVGTFKAGSSALDDALNGLTDGGYTNFEAPMQETVAWFDDVNADAGDNNVVYFLSDGKQNRGGAWEDEVATLEANYAASIVAVGVGENAVLDELNTVDNTGGAEIVNSTDALTAALIGADVIDESVDDTATLTVTVTGVNRGPDAIDDAIEIDEDGAVAPGDLNILDNDTDVEGDTLTVTAIENGAVGTPFAVETAGGKTVMVTVDATGGLIFETNGQFDTLPAGESDSFVLTYTADDGYGGTDTANVTVTINGLNEPPVAEDDAVTIDENGQVGVEDTATAVLNVLGNDSDPNLDTLSVIAVGDGVPGQPVNVVTANGVATQVVITAEGDVLFSTDGKFDTLPVGQSDSFTVEYTITDNNGGTDTANVTVTIDGVNEPPVAEDDAVSVSESGSIGSGDTATAMLNVLMNDTDPNLDDLTVHSISFDGGEPKDPGMALNVTTAGGRSVDVTIDAEGNVAFDTAGQFDDLNDGESDTFTIDYVAIDGNGGFDDASVTITVDGEGSATTPGDVSYNIIFVVDASTSAFSANDVDASVFDNLDISAHSVLGGDGVTRFEADGDGAMSSEFDAALLMVDQFQQKLIDSGMASDVDIGVGSFGYDPLSMSSVQLLGGEDSFVFGLAEDISSVIGPIGSGIVANLNGAYAAANTFFDAATTNDTGETVNLVYVVGQGTGAPEIVLGSDAGPRAAEAAQLFGANEAGVQMVTFESGYGGAFASWIAQDAAANGVTADAVASLTGAGSVEAFLIDETNNITDSLIG